MERKNEATPARSPAGYVVLKDFRTGHAFSKGEEVSFVRCQGYSRYDGDFVYEFRACSGELETCSLSAEMTEQQLYELMVLVF